MDQERELNCPTCGNDCDSLPLVKQMRARRIALGMSQARLAKVLGVNFTTIKRWEYGWHQPQEGLGAVIRMWLEKGKG